MKNKHIYWKKAVELLINGNKVLQSEINFNNEQIPIKEVGIFNKYKIRVPENLIFYDDDNIDCSDIPEITQEDIETGKIQWMKIHEFPLNNEIRSWIVNKNIKLNELLPYLLNNFYKSIKLVKKDTAI